MRRWGATLLASVVLGLATAPASAQQPAPIVGAGSFTSAPILEPGTYRDTVLPEEYLYYAVRVGAGQRLHVTASTDFTTAELQSLGLTFVQVNLHNPDRVVEQTTQGDSSFLGGEGGPADIITAPATATVEGGTSSVGRWTGPGVYFISVYAIFAGAGELTKAEVPFSVHGRGRGRRADRAVAHTDADADTERDGRPAGDGSEETPGRPSARWRSSRGPGSAGCSRASRARSCSAAGVEAVRSAAVRTLDVRCRSPTASKRMSPPP